MKPLPLLPPLASVEAELARRSLAEFVRQGWHVLEPSTPLMDNWHIDALSDHVQAALEGWLAVQSARMAGAETPVQAIQNLLVNIPPGTAKSRIVSVFAPAWMWLHCPAWRAIFISANPRVALRDSVYCRMLLESQWYRGSFGVSWTFAADQNAKGLYRNSAGGFRMAIGVGSRITGDRADALFVDDPNDAKEVLSQASRAGVNEWWDQGAGNRVNDLQTSLRIGIMQRLHEDDWSGHVLRSGQWVHLVLPMEFDPARAAGSPIGWRDPRTEEGELLFPQRFPPRILAAEKARLGEVGYAGQHQQAPAPKDGAIFKLGWFENRYTFLPPLTNVYTLWDTAQKTREENDESASLTLGTGADGNPYVVTLTHGRWDAPTLAQKLIAQADVLRAAYGAEYRGDCVEEAANGAPLMDYIRRERPDLVLIPVRHRNIEKRVRAHGVAPLCESRRVLLPDATAFPATQGWVRDLLAQLLLFPNGKHDDLVDVLAYALERFLEGITLDWEFT